MIELIENTLQIISKISSSKCGYLLRINNSKFEVLRISGEKGKTFDLINDALFHLYNSTGIDCDNVQKIPPFPELLRNISLGSFFIKDIVSFNERNETIYIILCFDTDTQLTDEIKNRIISTFTILSNQVKRWFEQNSNGNSDLKSNVLVEQNYEGTLLKNWEENFNHLMEISHDLIFILDEKGKFVLLNKPGFLLLEYSLNEIKGKHFTEFVDPEYNSKVTEAFNEAILENQVVKFEAGLHTRYEKIIPFEINFRAIKKDSEILGMLGIGKNISKEKSYECDLRMFKPKLVEASRLLKIERTRFQQQKSLIEELNRLKNEFISNISHEFRTPLASIIGFSETINSDPDLPPEMKKEFNNVILQEGKRLAKLINDVLDISKIEGGKVILNRSRVDGVKLVSEAVEVNRAFALEKKINLTYDHPSEEILIEADKERFSQVLDALLNNALKFTNEFGRVKVIVNNLFREFEVVISDTGIGIPEKDLPYIFQKFYRVSRPGTEIPGTGVGLVFVKQIIDLHKGLITVNSEVGSGTTFMVKLPKISKIERF